jgi:riboflavin kinase/FMN adenylyltransferase
MKIVRAGAELERNPNSVVSVGTFDGVHLGHLEIIRRAIAGAASRSGRSVVVTFEPHPKEVVPSARRPIHLLSTLDERLALLGRHGIDVTVVIHFTREFSQLSPRSFYEEYILPRIGVAEVVVGQDHLFGKDRKGGREELERLSRQFGFAVSAVPEHLVGGERVSSSAIRRALERGDVERAGSYLGYPYTLRGVVAEGEGRGRSLGFPTANLEPESPRKVTPGHGVYLVAVKTGSETVYGMMNIGVRPTLTDGSTQTLEVHMFEVDAELYGEPVQISFLRRLRDERRFASADDLTEQLKVDKEESYRIIKELEQQHSIHNQ